MSEPPDRHGPVRSALTRSFARHYMEMVLVMLVGMGALAVPAHWVAGALAPQISDDDPALMLVSMAATMTLPMIPWMRWRGHGWRPCLEMVAAMIVPTIGVIALLEAGVESVALLMTVEHIAMLGAMFVAMIARPDEYSRGRPVHHFGGVGFLHPNGEIGRDRS